MKKFILIITLLFITACTSDDSYQTISQNKAKKMMKEEKDYILLDVRTRDEYYNNHIDDAINIPLDELKNTTKLKDKDQIIFVYCQSGNRSKQASIILSDLGYTNIYDIGGINTWYD